MEATEIKEKLEVAVANLDEIRRYMNDAYWKADTGSFKEKQALKTRDLVRDACSEAERAMRECEIFANDKSIRIASDLTIMKILDNGVSFSITDSTASDGSWAVAVDGVNRCWSDLKFGKTYDEALTRGFVSDMLCTVNSCSIYTTADREKRAAIEKLVHAFLKKNRKKFEAAASELGYKTNGEELDEWFGMKVEITGVETNYLGLHCIVNLGNTYVCCVRNGHVRIDSGDNYITSMPHSAEEIRQALDTSNSKEYKALSSKQKNHISKLFMAYLDKDLAKFSKHLVALQPDAVLPSDCEYFG